MISAARGDISSDILIKNGLLVNVLTREIYPADIRIFKNKIINVAIPGQIDEKSCKRVLDASGRYIAPGFIESHLHIESTMLPPAEFSKLVVPHGTTTVLLDPHEIGNTLGVNGLKFLLDHSEDLPLRFLIEIPSCVPAAPGLETSGHIIDSKSIQTLINNEPRFFGLGEVMNYPGVLFKDEEVLKKVLLGKTLKVMDGHSPNVSGNDLDAYISIGIGSDHESTTSEEFLEKLRKGMRVMARQGSLAKDLRNVLKATKNKNLDLRNCLLATDDRNVIDLYEKGHLNHQLQIAVQEGIDPIQAIQMVTINTATYLGLEKIFGSLSPGKNADIVILQDLENFQVETVLFDGIIVYQNNQLLWEYSPVEYPEWTTDTIKLKNEIITSMLQIKTDIPDGRYPMKIIEVLPHSLLTNALSIELEVKNGIVYPQPENDILSLSVIERYGINGNIGNGFIKGFGIQNKNFAMATTVAHDSHNLIITGSNPQMMIRAINQVRKIRGGYVVMVNDEIYEVPLPVAGLMSIESYQSLYNQLKGINKIFKELTQFDEPLMALSFMALPVIPHLKLTDKGLIDVDKFIFTNVII